MRKYWVTKDSIQGDQVIFRDEVFHHIFDVCRQDVGFKFEILCGDQKAQLVEVISVSKKQATAKILSVREIPALPLPHIHFVLSVPRFNVMEDVVEKSVEMGIHSIHPCFSDFSFVRKSSNLPESKIERWKKIVISATQQCGRGELMNISETTDLKNILKDFNRTKGRMGLFAYEGQAALNIRDYLENLQKGNSEGKHEGDGTTDQAKEFGKTLTEVWVFVGSEGGFSVGEVQEFQAVGLQPVTLGEQVLRVETACITLAAILKYVFRMF
jgi:16S rRNA (uracil1498-N3)-methyltransferase